MNATIDPRHLEEQDRYFLIDVPPPQSGQPEGTSDWVEASYGDVGDGCLGEDEWQSGADPLCAPRTAPSQPAQPPGNASLVQDVDGLFVGLILLDELHPHLEYVSEFNGEEARGFLLGLRPSPTGQGIRCDELRHCIHSDCCFYAGGDGFSNTAGAIQEHFEAQGGSDASSIALGTILIASEGETRMDELQRQCNSIKDGLDSIPNIDDFLVKLASLPDPESILFRRRRARQMHARPAQLDATDLNLVSDAIIETFATENCRDFEGADQWLVGEEILARIRTQCTRSHTRLMLDLLSRTIQQRLPHAPEPLPLTSEIAHEPQLHKVEQFLVLRSLRSRIIYQHRRLLQVSSGFAHGTAIQRLARRYNRYQDLFEVGVSSFKTILCGGSPTCLEDVFAYVCLAFAMAETLKNRGWEAVFCVEMEEFHLWHSCIADEEDRLAFLELVRLLWPQVLQRYNNHLLSTAPGLRFRLDDADDWNTYYPKCSDSFTSSLLPISHQTDGHSLASDIDTIFSDWLIGLDSDDASSCLDSQHPDISQPKPIVRPCYGGAPSTATRGAMLVGVAIAFLTFIGGLGALLLCFSGNGENLFSSDPTLSATMTLSRFSRFVEVVKFRVLNPLCLDDSVSSLHPIFRAVVKIVEAGWLRTIRDVEKYLLCIIAPFAKGSAVYVPATSKVLHWCLEASKDDRICSEHIYRDNHSPDEDYSPEYVSRRIQEQEAAFTNASESLEQNGSHHAPADASTPSSDLMERLDLPGGGADVPRQKRRCSYPANPKTKRACLVAIARSKEGLTLECDAEGCTNVYTGGDASNSLYRHKREKHGGLAFTCTAPFCGHQSKRRHNLRVHWNTKHPGLELPVWMIGAAASLEGGLRKKRKGRTG